MLVIGTQTLWGPPFQVRQKTPRGAGFDEYLAGRNGIWLVIPVWRDFHLTLSLEYGWIWFIILVVSHTSMKYVKSSGFHLTLSLYIYHYHYIYICMNIWIDVRPKEMDHEGICTSWVRFDDHGGHWSRMWKLDLNISQHLWASCQSCG